MAAPITIVLTEMLKIELPSNPGIAKASPPVAIAAF